MPRSAVGPVMSRSSADTATTCSGQLQSRCALSATSNTFCVSTATRFVTCHVRTTMVIINM